MTSQTQGRPRGSGERRAMLHFEVDADAPVYVISVAAELTGLHPQTLRTYDRLGLVSPGRTGSGGRRYSLRDIEQLRHVTQLTAEGIGLEGVRRVLELEDQVAALQARIAELEGMSRPRRYPPEGTPFALERMPRQSTALVLWRRRTRRG